MKVLSTIFVAFVMALSLNVTANSQDIVEIYGLGSSDFGFFPCDIECPPCPEFEICVCFCPDETLTTNFVSQFGGETALYKISPNTGNPNFIGYTGFAGCHGLEISPLNGDFYAVCHRLELHGGPPGPPGPAVFGTNNAEEGGQFLVHINENTGEGTEIGPLGDGIGYLSGTFVSDISFYPDGTLYAHLHATDVKDNPRVSTSNGATANMLGTIDLDTGAFTPIGPTNSDDFHSAIGFSIFGDLIQCATDEDFNPNKAFDEVTNLGGLSFTNINSLNTATGNASFLRAANFPSDVDGHFNTITSKDVDEASGTFYAFLETQDNIRNGIEAETNNLIPNGTYLVTIDPNSGDVELIGQTSPPFEDFLAIATKTTTRNVPTMSEYGLMATAVLLLAASAIYLRRRQARLEA